MANFSIPRLDASRGSVASNQNSPAILSVGVVPRRSLLCPREITVQKAAADHAVPSAIQAPARVRAVVCAHLMSYPTPQITFISYRDKSTASRVMRPNTIHCCSEHSEYDPAAGAKVVGGPAPQPLAAVLLEHDAKNDTLHAIGTLGGELFNAFFTKYEFKLAIDYGSDKTRQPVAGSTVVKELQQFCKQQVRC